MRGVLNIRIILNTIVVLAVTVGFTAFATPALAAPAWQHCSKIEGGGSFEDSLCTKESETGEYVWQESKVPIAVVGTGSLELEDSESSSGVLRVKCSAELLGTVGPESQGKIKALKVTGCSVIKGKCESTAASIPHLPWQTKLGASQTKISDIISSDGSGAPGYTIVCGGVEDKCEYETTSAGVTNSPKEGAVELAFGSISGKAKCNHGGKVKESVSGAIEGTIKIKAENGEAIQGAVYRVTALRLATIEPNCHF